MRSLTQQEVEQLPDGSEITATIPGYGTYSLILRHDDAYCWPVAVSKDDDKLLYELVWCGEKGVSVMLTSDFMELQQARDEDSKNSV